MDQKHFNKLTYIFILMLMTACSSNIPPDIREPVEGEVQFMEVKGNVQNHLSRKFRWGGVIIGTENKQESSWITIVAFPLDDNGRPRITDISPGRFIAVANQFLEPLVYSQEREITVTGRLVKTVVQKVGEFDYEYPVLDVEKFYLWPPLAEVEDKEPYYYRPYYPFYGWPYFPHPYYYR